MKVTGHKSRPYRMRNPRYQQPRTKRLDLHRRAAVLGVSATHLSQVIFGRRESKSLLLRLERLLESESPKKNQPKSNHAQ